MTYARFFSKVTGRSVLPYQHRLGDGPWPEVIDIPTGLGKTAALIVAWLYKRLHQDPTTGRRLVYCLPMRVLVEQTRDAATDWCAAASEFFTACGQPTPTVHVLMGGDQDETWEAHPERPAIIIGTQDMLLSRALNRGYGMSRYRWPIHFGLLNNDCLWALDETQLMGVGVETSAQLDAFRRRFGCMSPSHTVWMSATLGQAQLATVDHPEPGAGWSKLTLDTADRDHSLVRQRVDSRKSLSRSSHSLSVDGAKAYAKELAGQVLDLHRTRGGLTLIILNRVDRAQQVYAAIAKAHGRDNLALIHSRFRAADRRRHESLLKQDTNRIVVATQAIEAGVDVSAHTLITELAPWPSMVQRFGRCNRYGSDTDAEVLWVDIEGERSLTLPYEADELATSRAILGNLAEVSPATLTQVAYEPPRVTRPVVRHRDVLELFDTTSDLLGDDLDVSRFIRDSRDTDVQLFWRNFDHQPPDDLPAPTRDELCAVSVVSANELRKKLDKRSKTDNAGLWEWDTLESRWRRARRVFPGQVLLARAGDGGYDIALGWTGEPAGAVPEVEHGDGAHEPHDADPAAGLVGGPWVGLTEHLGHVEAEARALNASLGLASTLGEFVALAARWHDVGKAHPEFQRRLLEPVADDPELRPHRAGLWAKSNHRKRWAASERPYFRHELASALAWLGHGPSGEARERNLVAYLIAAHHGKVRVSIRSVPGERPPEPLCHPNGQERLFSRGVWDGDALPDLLLPDGTMLTGVQLDLSVMLLGEGSWLERVLALRDADDLGPYRLAYLETLVRIADWRASQKEQERQYDDL